MLYEHIANHALWVGEGRGRGRGESALQQVMVWIIRRESKCCSTFAYRGRDCNSHTSLRNERQVGWGQSNDFCSRDTLPTVRGNSVMWAKSRHFIQKLGFSLPQGL